VESVLAAVLDPRAEVALDPRTVAPSAQHRDQVDVGTPDIGPQAGLPGQGQAALQPDAAGGDAAAQLVGADVVERIDEGVGGINGLGQCDRAPSPKDRPLAVVTEHADVRESAIGAGQLGALVTLLQ